MTNFDVLDNQFLSLSENELSDIDGGLAPLVIFGVAVSWKAIAGGTAGNDARIFSNISKIPTVILGPGLLKDCHTIDEKLDINEYYKYIINYANIILNFK